MKTYHLTNEQVSLLLKDLQVFWKKWRDSADNTEYSWTHIIDDANNIYSKYGDKSADLIGSFVKLIEDRVIDHPEHQEEKDYTH